jgi:chromosomal replication initiator protein
MTAPSLETVLAATCKHFQLPKKVMVGKGRDRDIAQCRMIGYVAAKDLTDAPLQQIGKVWGRDHTTVLAGINRVRARQADEQEDIEAVKELAWTLHGKIPDWVNAVPFRTTRNTAGKAQ